MKKKKHLFSRHAAKVLHDYIFAKYGSKAPGIWRATAVRYRAFTRKAPDYGGRKSPHCRQIYDSILLFSFCSVAPGDLKTEDLEPVAFEMFMAPFRLLGMVFNANDKKTMDLMSKVFARVGQKTNRHASSYPNDFIMEDLTYDREKGIVSYRFSQCPISDFAKAHGLGKWMPLMCNCDHRALALIHAGLVRRETCSDGSCCDYCIAGNRNPVMDQYKLTRNGDGLLLSCGKEDRDDKEVASPVEDSAESVNYNPAEESVGPVNENTEGGQEESPGRGAGSKSGLPAMRLHFTELEEARNLFFSNRDYLDSHNQNDYDYRMNKKGVSKEEYEAFAREQILEFSDEEIGLILGGMKRIKNRLNEIGFPWPIKEPVVFIKTTMREEGDAAAYTHKNQIYLSEYFCGYLNDEETKFEFDRILTHELFHLLTRYRPDFRQRIYDVIGFSVVEEPHFSDEVKRHIISNPDVERYDCQAVFTIDGQARDCTIVFAAPDYNGEAMFTAAGPALVAFDDPDHLIEVDRASDFYDIMGRNTDYLIAAEECLADNFSYAVTFGRNYDYQNPEIIERILDILSSYSFEGEPVAQEN